MPQRRNHLFYQIDLMCALALQLTSVGDVRRFGRHTVYKDFGRDKVKGCERAGRVISGWSAFRRLSLQPDLLGFET